MSGKRENDSRARRRGSRGWQKHLARRWRRLKPDGLLSWLGTWLLLAVGLAGMYSAGIVGLFAVVLLAVVAVFVFGVASRALERIVRRRR